MAGVPPKLTSVVPVKLVPVIVTVSPCPAELGEKESMPGAGMKIKFGTENVPPAVVTSILPELPFPTTAVISVAETTEKELVGVPPNLTSVVPVKLVPVIEIVSPCAAVRGEKEDIVGAAMKIKFIMEAVPPGVVISIFPEVPLATTALISVSEFTEKEAAAVPPKVTAVAPVKLVPEMVTVSP